MRRLRSTPSAGQSVRPIDRRGSMMTLFAVLLFALLPLMALIIHTGFITLTRRQMQAAANTGALEGLRFRDEFSEPDRREQVSRLVANLFDDDLNPGNGDPVQFGAGPVLNIAGGQTLGSSDFRASTTVSVPDDRAWKPGLLSNIGDARHGDMVAGDYVYDASDPDHDSHEESSNYTREDFDPRSGGDSFLVRLRRTHSPDGTAPLLDDVANVSSAGPTIPYLFGRVPYGNEDGGTSLLDQRERGTIVRATAIAQQQRVKAVGSPFLTIPGVSPFRMLRTHWELPTFGTLWVQDSGAITSDQPGTDIVGQMIRSTTLTNAAAAGDTQIQVADFLGFPTAPFTTLVDDEFVEVTAVSGNTWTIGALNENHAIRANVIRRGVVRVADTLSIVASGDPRGIIIPEESYLPVVEPIAGMERVIGFGSISLPAPTALPLDSSDYPFELTVTRAPNRVAAQNTTAVFLGFESDSSLDTILALHDEYDPMTVPFSNPLNTASLIQAID